MQQTLHLICPYCGNKFPYWFNDHDYHLGGIRTVRCDIEETNGCDKLFAFKPTAKIEVEYYTLEEVAND